MTQLSVTETNPYDYEMVSATDIGRIRTRNEDAVKIFPDDGVAILSDGMGGHRAGDVASQMAVDIIAQKLLDGENSITPERLIDSLEAANHSIREKSLSEPDCHGMGATVVVATFAQQRLLIAHAGDSRLYRFADGKLEQLTEDHTLAQQYVREGLMNQNEADRWVGRNMLVKGLGIDAYVEPDINEDGLQPECIYLLCSDGLTDAVSDDLIAATLRKHGDSLQDAVDRLITLANDNGGPDNISIVLARVREVGE